MKVILKNSSLVFQAENVEIDEATRTLMANYTSITEKHLQAVQVFLDTIGGLGGTIWTKIGQLYMPIFASAATQIFYDVKLGTMKYPPQLIDASNVATYYSANYGEGCEKILGFSGNSSATQFSVATDATTACTFAITPDNMDVRYAAGNGIIEKTLIQYQANVNGEGITSKWQATRDRTYVFNPKKGLASTFDVYVDGTKINPTSNTQNNDYTSATANNKNLAAWGAGQANSIGLVSQVCGYAQGITSTEAATLSSALEAMKNRL